MYECEFVRMCVYVGVVNNANNEYDMIYINIYIHITIISVYIYSNHKYCITIFTCTLCNI